ncbi:MAG: DUF1835 domain-containing protein [Chitinophagaceae bacterium]
MKKNIKENNSRNNPPLGDGGGILHIVFQHADVAILKKAIELDEGLAGEIFEIKDEFAVGPLENIDTEEGWQARENWWRELIHASPYADNIVGSFDDRRTVENLKKRLDDDEKKEAWIWMGQNQHDVCGYYWLISQLKNYQGRIMVLYLNNLPFINDKGAIFYPGALHEIEPKEFLKAKNLCRKVTLSEFELDPDEWNKLSGDNAMVRILEGGKKIVSKDEGFYDEDILNNLTHEWQKGGRAMHNILGKMKIKTGDVFLLWRMKKLADEGRIEINGDTSQTWKDFEVRLKTTSAEEVPINNEQG